MVLLNKSWVLVPFLLAPIQVLAGDELIRQAKLYISRDFKDPYSAVFEGIYLVKGPKPGSPPTVCGTVNAKNSFGAYVGRRRFYFVPPDIGSVDEDGTGPFPVVFSALCERR